MPKQTKETRKLIFRLWLMIGLLSLMIILPIISMGISFTRSDFSKTESANIAPNAQTYDDAVLQIYGADAYGWRGIFAIHTWISIKPKNAQNYTTYQVFGWNKRSGRPVLVQRHDIPDRFWFGATPTLLADFKGAKAELLIPKVEKAISRYPYKNEYTLWPGPNSNSFTAWVGLEVPELELELPFSAIGKHWMEDNYLSDSRQ